MKLLYVNAKSLLCIHTARTSIRKVVLCPCCCQYLGVLFFILARYRTQGLTHAKQVFYHRHISSLIFANFTKKNLQEFNIYLITTGILKHFISICVSTNFQLYTMPIDVLCLFFHWTFNILLTDLQAHIH